MDIAMDRQVIRIAALMFAALVLLLGAATPAAAADGDPRAEAIIERASRAQYYAGSDGRSAARMLIVDRRGTVQQRQFVILRRNLGDDRAQQFLVVFNRPADVRGTVLLVHKHAGGDDDRWLYLPALDLERRIAAGDKRTSFVGSDFYYEDISGRDPALDDHRLVEEGEGSTLIRSTPKEPGSVEFAYSLARIDSRTGLPMRIEYHDADGRLIRAIEALEVAEVQGHPTVLKSRVDNPLSGGHTLLDMRDPAYDIGLDDDAFTTRALRNPPRQWLRP
jgi:hypothetical protein